MEAAEARYFRRNWPSSSAMRVSVMEVRFWACLEDQAAEPWEGRSIEIVEFWVEGSRFNLVSL